MLYSDLRAYNWLFAIFGQRKPFDIGSENSSTKRFLHGLWSIALIALLISYEFYLIHIRKINSFVVYNLGTIFYMNDITLNSISVIVNLFVSHSLAPKLYSCIRDVTKKLNISREAIKIFTLKLYVWFVGPLIVTIVLICFEFYYVDGLILLTKMLNGMAILHLQIHLCIVIGLLKNLNQKITKKLNTRDNYDLFGTKDNENLNKSRLSYFLQANVYYFIENDKPEENMKLKTMCNIYDDLSSCIKLLEKLHGVQVLMEIWMNFIGGIAMITLLMNRDVEFHIKIMSVVRNSITFLWEFSLTSLDDQIRQEVETTDTLIIKHIIDFRCDNPERNMLQSFKQLVSTHRLRFKACGLFNINYAMLVGNIVSIVTYSIILLQLFFTE